MDAIVNAALMGTSRQRGEATESGTPIDALLGSVEGATPESRLLLLAGALAAYRRAGQVAPTLAEAPEPAPAETIGLCSPAAAELVRTLADAQAQSSEGKLFIKALERLNRAGRRLPPEMLPTLLGKASWEARAALAPVVGERGRWLGRLNSSWNWVDEATEVAAAAIPENADTIWQEATPSRRLRLLWLVRASDPARARAWIQVAWRVEKADFRADMVLALGEGLSAEDEPLLEPMLDDRSERVRGAVAPLLARIPTSAFNARMAERADTLLNYAKDKLTVNLPQTLDKAWQRDGITQKPRGNIGERSWWLRQVLALVPPSHWEERFGLKPEELIAVALAENTHAPELLESWSEAAQTNHDANWALALWNWSHTQLQKGKNKLLANVAAGMRTALPRSLPHETVQEYALRLLTTDDPPQDVEWDELASSLPDPWPLDFAQTYLRGLRRFVETRLTEKNYDTQPWYESVSTSALSLPPQSFAMALAPVNVPDPKEANWRYQEWRNRLNQFTHLISLRQRMIAEIPLADETGD